MTRFDPVKFRQFIAKLILVLSLAIAVFCFLEGYAWVGKKFGGFTISQKGRVTSLMHSRWTGYRSGLKLNDQILSFDGIAFESQDQLLKHLSAQESTHPVAYQVLRDHSELSISVMPMIFTLDDYLVTFFADLLIGLVGLFIAGVIFFLSPNLYGNFILFLSTAVTGFMQILSTDYYTNQALLFPLFLSFCLFAVIVSHANFDLFKKSSLLKFQPKLFGRLVLLTSALSAVVYLLFVKEAADHRIYSYTLIAAYALSFLIGHANCTYIYLTTDSQITRKIIRMFNLIFLLIIPAFAYYVCREIFGILLPREFVFLQIGYGIFIPLTVIRFHAMDYNIHLKRNTLFALVGTFFVAGLLLMFTMVPAVFRIYGFPSSYANLTLLAGTAFIVAFIIYSSHSRLFDRLFFYSTYKFKDMIEAAGDQILSKLSSEEILTSLSDILGDHFKIQRRRFYLKADNEAVFILQGEEICVPNSIPGEKIENEMGEFLILSDMNPEHQTFVGDMMLQNRLLVFLPLTFQNKIIGLCFLGEKSDHTPYSPEDITNLQTIMKTTATALMNARQHDAVVRLKERLKIENQLLKEEVRGGKVGDLIIGERGDLREIFENIEKIKNSDVTVLLRGESGVGKEVVARALHDRSARSDKPFIAVNCTAIPETLLENELFGHEKGAFTGATSQKIGLFEAAHEGTLFLDEIGDISPAMQLKLLRVLQEKEIKRVGAAKAMLVDVRVIAATNKNLEEAVQKNKMRQDLYYRLNVFPIFIPPLRERKKDLEDLIYYFIRKFSGKMQKTLQLPDRETWARLLSYSWPGNVRELANVIERSVALCPNGEPVKIHDLEGSLWDYTQGEIEKEFSRQSYHEQMGEFQKRIVRKAIQKAGGNKTQAARRLGIHVTHLYKMIKQIGDV